MADHLFNKQTWAAMTMFEQLGNIGSEVGRALKAKSRGDVKSMNGAFYRGMDLIGYTAELWAARKAPALTELLRAKELFGQSILTDCEDPTLESYFMQYALAARRDK